MSLLDPLHYTFSIHAIAPGIVGCLLTVLAILVLVRNRASFESIIFTLMLFAGMVWQFSYVGLYTAANEETAWFWAKMEHAGVVFIPSFLYLFASMMVRRAYKCRFYLVSCFALSCFFLVSVFEGHLFIASLERYEWGYYARYGVLGTAFVVLFFISMIANLTLYWTGYKHSENTSRKRLYFSFFLAFAIAQLGAVDFFAVFGIPVYPLGFIPVLAFVLVLVRTIWKVRLSEITASLVAGSLLEAVPSLVFVVDRREIIQIANRAACEFFGLDVLAITGMPVSKYLGPHSNRTKQQGILKNQAGESRYYKIEMHPIHHPQQGFVGTIFVASDETDRLRANEAVRIQQKQFQDMIESIVDCAIIRLSPEGLIETCSQGTEILFRCKDHQLPGMHFSMLFPERKRLKEVPTQILLEASQRGRYEDSETWLRLDNSEFVGEIVLTSIRSESNRILGFTVVLRDLSIKSVQAN